MSAVKDDESVAVDREIDAEKSQGPSDPRIRCPLLRLVAPQRRPMVL
jgi:hypothetical protein